MNKFIKKLQSKPESTRQKILITSASVITLIIFAFWIASFSRHFTTTANTAKTVETSPFSVLKANLGSAYNSIFDVFQASTSTSAE